MSKTPLGTAIRAFNNERSKQQSEQSSIEESNNASKIASDNASMVLNDNTSEVANDKATSLSSDKNSEIESEQSSAPPVELVGLNIRVPKNHRLHWLIAAKKEGSSLTAAVNEALTARYGLPNEE